MQPQQNSIYDVFIGIDWADKKHDFFIKSQNNEKHLTVSSSPEELTKLIKTLHEENTGHMAVAVECSKGPIINFLAQFPFITIFEINPVAFSNYRKTFRISSAKDDKSDCKLLCEILYKNLDHFKPLDTSDKESFILGELCEKRRRAVCDRTKMTNRLRQLLKKYYPQALEHKLLGEFIFCQMACDFLKKWPSLQKLKRAADNTISQFYMKHQCKRKDVIQKRLAAIQSSVPLTDDKELIEVYIIELEGLLTQINAVNKVIRKYDLKIEEKIDMHEDAEIFMSFPGMAKNMAARMIQAFGTDRTRYKNVEEFINYVGVSPVTIQSGNSKIIRRRYAKPTFIHQTFVEFAGYAMQNSQWAKLFKQCQVFKGSKGFKIRRSIAYKWTRILFACWKNRVKYDEQKYMKAMKRSSSPYAITL
jgi:transposase